MDEVAEIDDGWLRVYYLKPAGLLAILWALPALRFGWLRRSPVAEVRQTRRVEISTCHPRPPDIDGERKGPTTLVAAIDTGDEAVFSPCRTLTERAGVSLMCGNEARRDRKER